MCEIYEIYDLRAQRRFMIGARRQAAVRDMSFPTLTDGISAFQRYIDKNMIFYYDCK